MPEQMTKQDAIEYLLYMKHDVHAKSPMDIALDTAIEALKQPTIEPGVRNGRWIYAETIGGMKHYYCTSCKCLADENQILWFTFCPKCGAKMDLRTPTEAALDIADSVMMGGDENG